MAYRVPTSELAQREYVTAPQAARLFGRGSDFWTRAFCRGEVEGYRDGNGKRQVRYLNAASCREYLARLAEGYRSERIQFSDETRRTLREFRARQRAKYQQSA